MELDRIHNVEDWERRISQSYFPLVMNHAQSDFEASIATVDLPRGMRVSKVDVEANHLKRTGRLVRAEPSEHVLVLFQHTGKAIMRQTDREVLIENGSAAIADPSEPYEVKMTQGSHQMVLLVPAASIRSAGAQIAEVRTRLLPGNSLATKTLSSLAADIVENGVPSEEAEGLAAACFDLLRGALGRLGGSPPSVGAVSHEAQRRLVEEYIHRHLGDPGLNVEAVARAHQISTRHLATLFGSNVTPGAYIRQARLQRIFDDLTNPGLAGMTAASIASRWGVDHYPTLSRAFRREFGLTPVEARAYGRWPKAAE
ncbi:helix-turn-helix domain-containing protein [Arthrobacter sp. NPDC056493]|uniref:AraC-like ligand-binding domain-containing protein n=1 Tax=Arthrobacter sp. NPDC056493 TaxID=3345839 RepID=UPI00367315B0